MIENIERAYILMLLIIVIVFACLFDEQRKELTLIKKECINRGYAFYECDNSGKAIFKFKTQEQNKWLNKKLLDI